MQVEAYVGQPIKVNTVNDQLTEVTYEYEIGNESSAGRALGHAAMDVLTLGIWEVAGTPIEALQGDKYHLIVVYDNKDIAQTMTSLPASKKSKKSKNKTEPEQTTAEKQVQTAPVILSKSTSEPISIIVAGKSAPKTIPERDIEIDKAMALKTAKTNALMKAGYGSNTDFDKIQQDYKIIDVGYDDQGSYQIVLEANMNAPAKKAEQ